MSRGVNGSLEVVLDTRVHLPIINSQRYFGNSSLDIKSKKDFLYGYFLVRTRSYKDGPVNLFADMLRNTTKFKIC